MGDYFVSSHDIIKFITNHDITIQLVKGVLMKVINFKNSKGISVS